MAANKQTAGFDLSAFDDMTKAQEKGTEISVLNPATEEPIGWYIRIAGPDSEQTRRAVNKVRNERLKNQSRRLTAEKIDQEGREQIAAAIIDWRFDEGVVLDGQQPAFSRETAVDFMRRWPWLRDQIEAKIGDRSAFLAS